VNKLNKSQEYNLNQFLKTLDNPEVDPVEDMEFFINGSVELNVSSPAGITLWIRLKKNGELSVEGVSGSVLLRGDREPGT
jgi:hypothetical protein